MNLEIREAAESDLPGILRLYAQPRMNDARVLSLEAATAIFRKLATYPFYRVYVATRADVVVGTFEPKRMRFTGRSASNNMG